MAKLTKDYNLEVLYPEIAKEWHPTKNGDLKPNEVLPGSAKKVWWKCENNHEYFAHIRVQTKSGCKKCLGVSQGFIVYKDGKKIGYWNNQKDCASDLGLKIQLISRCLNNEEKTHKGYNFKKI